MNRRSLFGVLFLSILVVLSPSCMKRGYDLEQIRERAEAFDREITLSWYETDNYGKPSRLTEIYEAYGNLFSDPGLIQFVQDELNQTEKPRKKRQLEYLHQYLIEEYAGLRAGELDDLVLDIQAQEELQLKDQTVAFRDVNGELFNSSDRQWRRDLYQVHGDLIISKINPLLRQRLEIQRETCREFGYDNYADFQDRTHFTDFDQLAQLCEELLYQTELIYRELVAETANRVLGLPLQEVQPYDRLRLFRGENFDGYFPRERMVALLLEVLGELGIDLTEQDNIDLDVEDRPEKEPRPACYMISVPDDIRVLVKPLGGADDYESLFHEMGHAEHYAHVQSTEYEFRILGEDGVTESYAFLFENLFMDPKFLEAKMSMPPDVARAYVGQGLMADLSSLRYYCALFLFERALHAGAEDPSWLYRDLWERARLTRMSLPQAEADYLMANEDFYSVGYLEAWLLEAQLREKLRQEYGDYWFSDPRTGQLLKDLWALGSEKPVGELAQELGYGALDAGPLRRETERLFHFARGTGPSMDRQTAGRL